MESKDEKTSDTENNEKINFKIYIATGGEFNITANSKEIFREVLDKFLESHNKKELESMNTGICNGGIVDFDKNLEENNIKENTNVILYDLKKDFTPNPDDLNELLENIIGMNISVLSENYKRVEWFRNAPIGYDRNSLLASLPHKEKIQL